MKNFLIIYFKIRSLDIAKFSLKHINLVFSIYVYQTVDEWIMMGWKGGELGITGRCQSSIMADDGLVHFLNRYIILMVF